MKLIELLRVMDDGFDVADDLFDMGVYFYASDNCGDYYDRVMLFFAQNIEVVKFQKDWYTICKIAEFIEANREAFDNFMNEVYNDAWQPQNRPKYTIDDEEWYDLYIDCFLNLVNGNFSESDYELLYGFLMEGK